MPVSQMIAEEAARFELSPPAEVVAQLERYLELISQWGGAMRLTGSIDTERIVRHHLPDAFMLARLLGETPGCVLDVGSGGGLPALPALVLCPALRGELVESTGRKCSFLRAAVHALGLNAVVRQQRAEALVAEIQRGDLAPFDAAWSRATLAYGTWLALGHTLVAESGRVFAYAARSDSVPPPPPGLVCENLVPYALSDGTPRVIGVYRKNG